MDVYEWMNERIHECPIESTPNLRALLCHPTHSFAFDFHRDPCLSGWSFSLRTIYESDITDSKAQVRALTGVIGTLLNCKHFPQEDYEALITKVAQVCMYVYMYVRIYVCMYICMYVCMCVYKHSVTYSCIAYYQPVLADFPSLTLLLTLAFSHKPVRQQTAQETRPVPHGHALLSPVLAKGCRYDC
jgi:Vacuolar protein sorting-associated protein 35